MNTATIIMNLIKAELVGILSAKQIHDIACVAQENINASNSVISNSDLEGICIATPRNYN